MLLMRTGTDPGQRKGDPVNALSVIFVNDHLNELQAMARQHPAADLVTKRSMRERIAAATASLRSVVGSTDDTVVPKLRNYPYGG
jgi:hypothetical protein